eukprot:CAMPEP_0206543762 /NCGR_PEP_ID=MMETSP0325_2-20121206/11088_1 /ASSEMBLY_ACC=CAM_ASM_000347 /TAXON_ID=2866 /ORGANISM="Crypthecodinium cohnii, Strain Seligo" /LENGTH=1370 /DNA_ID=CAMNT_0054042327 /DNA_START=128 /DNA_END=4240 /DNA_ORIENTATION=+
MANVLIQGDLGLHKRKSVEVRYFVLKDDRLEYFLTQDDFTSGMDPRGQLKKSEMQSVQLEANLILQLRLIQGHALRLSIPEGAQAQASIETWMQKFGEIGISSFIPIDDDSDDSKEEKARAFQASAMARKSLADAGEAGAQHIKETLARLKGPESQGEASLPAEPKDEAKTEPPTTAEASSSSSKEDNKEDEPPSPDAPTPAPTSASEPELPTSAVLVSSPAQASEPTEAAAEPAEPPAVEAQKDPEPEPEQPKTEESKPSEPAPKSTPRKSRAEAPTATTAAAKSEARKSLAPTSADARKSLAPSAKARAGSSDARKSRASFGGNGTSPMFPQAVPKRASLSPSPSAAASVRKTLNAGVTDPMAKRKSRASVKPVAKAAASPTSPTTEEETPTPTPADSDAPPAPTAVDTPASAKGAEGGEEESSKSNEEAAAAATAAAAAAEAEQAEKEQEEGKEQKQQQKQEQQQEQQQQEDGQTSPVPQPQEEPQPTNPRVIDVDDDEEAPTKPRNVAIEGLLDIVKRKKSETRYFVMLSKHVEYYDSKEDFDSKAVAKGKLLFRDLSSVGSDKSLIKVTVSGKAIELKASDDASAGEWTAKWKEGWQRVGGKPVDEEGEAALGGDLEASPAASGSERGSVSFAAIESETFHVDAVTSHDHNDEDETSTAGSTPPATSDPEVSQEEKEKIKNLTNWVRGGKPPLKKGVFEWQKDDTGLKTTKYLELFDDGILYYDAPADSQGHSSPFSPEGKIKLVDVKDIEPTEDGFDVVMKAGCKIKLRGPQNAAGGRLDDWLEKVGEAIEGAKAAAEKAAEEEAAHQAEQDDEDDGEPPLMLGPVACNKGPGQDKVEGEALLKPLELVLPAAEGKKPQRIPLRDIKEVLMTPEGFLVETLDGRKILVEAPAEESESWCDAWDAALQDGFERADDGHWRRRKVLPLARANIIVARNGEEAMRHVVCYTDRFAIYKDEDSARRKERALHEIWPSQVRMVRVHDDGIALRTDEDEFDLRFPNEGGELDRFYDAMRTCFSRRPVEIEGLEEEYAEEPAPPTNTNDENPESPSQNNTADDDAEHLRQLAELPPSADPRAVQLTMPRRGDKKNKAICQGMLGFYDHGRLHMLYSILYPDRLDAFECVEAVLWSNPPKMTLRVPDMMSLEALSAGFLLEVHDPLHKKLGVNVATQQELKIWVARLNEVMQKCKDGGDVSMSTPRKGQKSNNNMGDRSGGKVPMPQKAKPGFVPRCAFVIYKSPREASPDWSESRPRVLKQSRSIHLSKHTPPESHNGKKKRGVVINTHRAGWQAHGLVERGRVVNPSDMLNPPTPRPQAPDRADKISNHVTCPRMSPEQKMAFSPVGNRTITKPAEPGSCPWQKITSSSY